MTKDSINKTILYEVRKRNEAPRRKLAPGFSPVGEAKGENQSLIFAYLCWILGRSAVFLSSRTQSYITRVLACIVHSIKYVPYIFHYRPYASLAMLWQEKGCLFVTPPSLLIRQQKVTKMNYEIRGTSDDVCPWGTAGRNINTCHATA